MESLYMDIFIWYKTMIFQYVDYSLVRMDCGNNEFYMTTHLNQYMRATQHMSVFYVRCIPLELLDTMSNGWKYFSSFEFSPRWKIFHPKRAFWVKKKKRNLYRFIRGRLFLRAMSITKGQYSWGQEFISSEDHKNSTWPPSRFIPQTSISQ